MEKNIDIYGTLGPACKDLNILRDMFACGMTGIRLNLSHVTLEEAAPMIDIYHQAAALAGVSHPGLLIDMQGPEIRLGKVKENTVLHDNEEILMDPGKIPFPAFLLEYMGIGQDILMDDGKLLLRVVKIIEGLPLCHVIRGGKLLSKKSIALVGKTIPVPAITDQDRKNLQDALTYGVTGIMQPFVRSKDDLIALRQAMNEAGCGHLSIFAKIENLNGVTHLEDFFGLADEIVIARGDLGNAMDLWQLPAVQKEISDRCNQSKVPFMVVTQMLASMETHPLPTRAEVSDIFHAILDGASSVMVTGETAVGAYPVEVIRYLASTVGEALNYISKNN